MRGSPGGLGIFSKIGSRLTYANVIATLALIFALGGGAYAALKLPRNSVGSRQLKANAVRSSKVKDGSLLSEDFKAGQLPAGAPGVPGASGEQGIQGVQGIQGLQGDKGDKGDDGARGPGTLSFDGQFEVDSIYHTITTNNGLELSIYCANAGATGVGIRVQGVGTAQGFHAWGTIFNGAALGRAAVVDGGVEVLSNTTEADLHIAAQAPGPGVTPGYTHIDLNGIQGSKCNYHALLIPPA